MGKELVIFVCGLFLMISAALAADSIMELDPVTIPGIELIDFEGHDGNSAGSCYWLSYYDDACYYWKTPNFNSDRLAVAQRFTAAQPETLMQVNIMLYDDESGYCGNDTVYCTIYSDDGSGFPGTLVAQAALSPGSYSFLPEWTTFDFTPFITGPPIIVNGDFHVAFSSSGTMDDFECCLSDCSHLGLGRSSVKKSAGTWTSILDVMGEDVNFLFSVYLCGGMQLEIWSKDTRSILPDNYELHQNYPNPFNIQTEISFEIPRRSQVTLTIFNVLGMKVASLINEELPAGSHSIIWNGKNGNGIITASGVYFYQLQTKDFSETKKMTLIK
jgi:hypothetical protein